MPSKALARTLSDDTGAAASGAANAARAVARILGGKRVLGIQVDSEADIARLVDRRISVKAIEALKTQGLSDDEINYLVIPRRTLSHRHQKKEPLTVEESDRAVRLARLLASAQSTFGNRAKADGWLRKPLRTLTGRRPLELAHTDVGARMVENLLARIAWGAAA
ncbi:MAG: DUF2384 domain-containing protein [Alphaproteobacteria bacterium]|nr:DUF2384 domain-containing protein [Alphaproteobacteria bacterium]